MHHHDRWNSSCQSNFLHSQEGKKNVLFTKMNISIILDQWTQGEEFTGLEINMSMKKTWPGAALIFSLVQADTT